MKRWKFYLAVVLALGARAASAATITFEDYASGSEITTQYSGVSLDGAVEATTDSVASLIAYTPNSGTGFIINSETGEISATFAALQSSVSGWYAAYMGFTVNAFDANDNLLTSSEFAGNLGNAPWSITATDIAKVTFTAPTGTLALDDLTYTAGGTDVTPEPGSLLLLSTGLLAGAAMCVARASRRPHVQEA